MRERLLRPAWLLFLIFLVCTGVWIGALGDIPSGVLLFLGLSFAYALLVELLWTEKLYVYEIYSLDAYRTVSKKTPPSVNVVTVLYFGAMILVLRSFLLNRPLGPLEARYALLAFAGGRQLCAILSPERYASGNRCFAHSYESELIIVRAIDFSDIEP